MNHLSGSTENLEVLHRISEAPNENLESQVIEIIDVYWRMEWRNIFFQAVLYWLHFLLLSIYIVGFMGSHPFGACVLAYTVLLLLIELY